MADFSPLRRRMIEDMTVRAWNLTSLTSPAAPPTFGLTPFSVRIESPR
jgi:hypothetical protein